MNALVTVGMALLGMLAAVFVSIPVGFLLVAAGFVLRRDA